jgi:hypothetical protein
LKMIKLNKTYCELVRLKTFEERFEYLKLQGSVGVKTFGFDRWINQRFYTSRDWQKVRSLVIARDNGCDLSFPGREIYDIIYIHHMNPVLPSDLHEWNPDIVNLDFLICTRRQTHLAIHFGDKEQLQTLPITRKPGDTRLW